MKNKNEKSDIKPKVTIVLDCVPTNIEERKNNIRKFYDVCNEVIDDPSCFYTEQEIEELKNNPKKQKELNSKLKKLYNIYAETDDDDDSLISTINDLKKQLKIVNDRIKLDTQNAIIYTRRKERTQILSTVNELWETMDFKQKKNVVRKLVNKVEITGKNIHIDFSI